MTEAEAIADILDTIQSRIRILLAKYEDEYPDLWENYTLVELLYTREFDLTPSQGVIYDVLTYLAGLAAEGRLTKYPSIHRALTIVKKDFQTAEQRWRSAELEGSWGEAVPWVD